MIVRISTSHGALSDVSLDVPIGPGYDGVWMETPSLQQPVDLGKIFPSDDSDLYKPKENSTDCGSTMRSSLPGLGLLRILLHDLGSPFPVHHFQAFPCAFGLQPPLHLNYCSCEPASIIIPSAVCVFAQPILLASLWNT